MMAVCTFVLPSQPPPPTPTPALVPFVLVITVKKEKETITLLKSVGCAVACISKKKKIPQSVMGRVSRGHSHLSIDAAQSHTNGGTSDLTSRVRETGLFQSNWGADQEHCVRKDRWYDSRWLANVVIAPVWSFKEVHRGAGGAGWGGGHTLDRKELRSTRSFGAKQLLLVAVVGSTVLAGVP